MNAFAVIFLGVLSLGLILNYRANVRHNQRVKVLLHDRRQMMFALCEQDWRSN